MVKFIKNLYNYIYVIIDDKTNEGYLVDPAWNLDNINAQLSDIKLKGILLTHHHFDHMNLAGKIALQHEIPVYMSKVEIDFYQFKCKNLIPLENDTPLPLGSSNVKTIDTPGHTKGSACYYFDGNLFTGDTVFIEGCGLCSAEGGDPYQMFESIQKLKEMIHPDTAIYPGHSYGLDVGVKMSFLIDQNIYFHFDDVTKFVNFRMRNTQRNLFSFK